MHTFEFFEADSLRARVTAASQLPHHMDEKVQTILLIGRKNRGRFRSKTSSRPSHRSSSLGFGARYTNSRGMRCSVSLRTRPRSSSFSRLTGLAFDGIALMQFQERGERKIGASAAVARNPADSDHAALRFELTPSRTVHHSTNRIT